VRTWSTYMALRLARIHDRYKVRLEEGFDRMLIVDGVPVIEKSKPEKLLAQIAKEFTKRHSNLVIYPCHETKRATGRAPHYCLYAIVFEPATDTPSSNSEMPMWLHMRSTKRMDIHLTQSILSSSIVSPKSKTLPIWLFLGAQR
jgi:hypothetical protein